MDTATGFNRTGTLTRYDKLQSTIVASFLEALAKQRVWHWLEESKGYTVDGEVNIGTGRIDLLAESPSGEIIGVELKRASEFGLDRDVYAQTHRYIDSGALDKLYFAAPDADKLGTNPESDPVDQMSIRAISYRLAAGVDEDWYTPSEVITHIRDAISADFLAYSLEHRTVEDLIRQLLDRSPEDNEPISLDEAVQELRRTQLPEELGVIHVPIEKNGSKSDFSRLLTPGDGPIPSIVRDAEPVYAGDDTTGQISPTEEPWVRHHTWTHFGGIPEAHIPNDLDSDTPTRPIDILAFEGDIDPTTAVETPESNAVIGIEAKGESSFSGSRKTEQIEQFLATETLSKLYLAVPTTLSERAVTFLEKQGFDTVGLITVDDTGGVNIVPEATHLTPKYDGYLENHHDRKVGYGDLELPWLEPVSNLYLTDEEAERVKHPDPVAYAKPIIEAADLDVPAGSWIDVEDWTGAERTEDEFTKERVRYYLLRGVKAGPYLLDSDVDQDEMMGGYTRLALEWFEDTDEPGLKLNFGGGSWVGGYLWFTGKSIQQLLSVLLNISDLNGATIRGQGKVIDLETFPIRGDSEHLRLQGRFGEEDLLELEIRSLVDEGEGDEIFEVDLGTGEKAGVTAQFTEPQWYDLVATLDHLLAGGTYRGLPGEFDSTPRIGPLGEDTWDIGTDIEETSNPVSIEMRNSDTDFLTE
ncbi:hypothetical protein [Halorientalis salina]|uniref:hypothetical protein n=1 Tax=Halorientalis salina TaxID=2932266 RepID=UPI0010AB5E1E|nr:hypothetical protein [Halorientalis salina]